MNETITLKKEKPSRGSLEKLDQDMDRLRNSYFDSIKGELEVLGVKPVVTFIDFDISITAFRSVLCLFTDEQIQELLRTVDNMTDKIWSNDLKVEIQYAVQNRSIDFKSDSSIARFLSQETIENEDARNNMFVLQGLLEESLAHSSADEMFELNQVPINSLVSLGYFAEALSAEEQSHFTNIVHQYLLKMFSTNLPDTKIHPFNRNTVSALLPYVPEEYRRKTFAVARDKKLLTQTPKDVMPNPLLYKNNDKIEFGIDIFKNLIRHLDVKMHGDRFTRADFGKTDSYITTLTGTPLAGIKASQLKSLRNNVLVRHIKLEHLLYWVKAYRAVEVWQKLGFDYVPIEPILGVRKSKKENAREGHEVDVFSVVLGSDVEALIKKTEYIPLWNFYIERQIELIKEGFEILGINHGHAFPVNFCITFPLDNNDVPDLTKPPRVYSIDLDEARMAKN